MPDTPPPGGAAGFKAHLGVGVTVIVALAMAMYLVILAFGGGPDRDPSAATTWTSLPTEPAIDEPAEEPAADVYDDPTPTPTSAAERALTDALDTAAARGDDVGTLEDGRDVCGVGDADPPTLNDLISTFHNRFGGPSPKTTELAIRHLCPKYLPLLAKARRGFTDGSYTVGDDIKPGTYRTNKRITDCYWERSTPGGDIIDNGYVTNAPQGVTVTVRSGEGFTSQRCGNWFPA